MNSHQEEFEAQIVEVIKEQWPMALAQIIMAMLMQQGQNLGYDLANKLQRGY